MWGVYFCMGAYKRDVVAVIKIGAYYPDFTVAQDLCFFYHISI